MFTRNQQKPLVVYAFYGLGKTTLAETHPNLYYDDDWAVPNPEPYKNQAVILTNKHWRDDIDLVYLPKALVQHIKQLPDSKKQFFKDIDPSFLKEVYRLMGKKNPFYCHHITSDLISTHFKSLIMDTM